MGFVLVILSVVLCVIVIGLLWTRPCVRVWTMCVDGS